MKQNIYLTEGVRWNEMSCGRKDTFVTSPSVMTSNLKVPKYVRDHLSCEQTI